MKKLIAAAAVSSLMFGSVAVGAHVQKDACAVSRCNSAHHSRDCAARRLQWLGWRSVLRYRLLRRAAALRELGYLEGQNIRFEFRRRTVQVHKSPSESSYSRGRHSFMWGS